MAMDDIELGWLAGLLEGEGCFHVQRERWPRITLQMTDEDVVRRLYEVTQVGRVNGPYFTSGHAQKPAWRWIVSKRDDVEDLLIAVYPLMGERRQAKIQTCLAHTGVSRFRTHCKLRGHPMTPDNVYTSPKGRRHCIACFTIRTGTPPKRLVIPFGSGQNCFPASRLW